MHQGHCDSCNLEFAGMYCPSCGHLDEFESEATNPHRNECDVASELCRRVERPELTEVSRTRAIQLLRSAAKRLDSPIIGIPLAAKAILRHALSAIEAEVGEALDILEGVQS